MVRISLAFPVMSCFLLCCSCLQSPMLVGLDNFLHYDLLDGLLHVLCSYWRLKLYMPSIRSLNRLLKWDESNLFIIILFVFLPKAQT
jgi:hypothetical protein